MVFIKNKKKYIYYSKILLFILLKKFPKFLKKKKKILYFPAPKIATLKVKKPRFLYLSSYVKNFNYMKWIYLIFMSFVKKGKKTLNLKFYLNILIFLKKKYRTKLHLNNIFHLFFLQIFYSAVPSINYLTITKRKSATLIPFPNLNKKNQKKKMLALSLRWFRNSLQLRREKTIFLKIFSELLDIRLYRSSVIQNKKKFYKQFFVSKAYKKLVDFNWI